MVPLADPNALPFVVSEAVGAEPDRAARPLAPTVPPAEPLQRFWALHRFVPAVPLGLIPLYHAFVTRSDGVDVVPLQGLVDVRLKGLPWLEYCRQRIPGLRQAMRIGRTIRMAVNGDSVTEQGGGPGPGSCTVPDGTYRDTALQSQGGDYWTGRIGADVVDGLPGYDQGDGNSRHIRVGRGWRLKEAIEAASACTVIHDNWGVGGTEASRTEPNGNYPPRINALITSNPDVVVICFGMNELGSAFTCLRIRAMIQALRAGGAEVIVMGVPLIATFNGVNSIDEWRETNWQVEPAALDEDVAVVPMAAHADPDSPVPLGGLAARSPPLTASITTGRPCCGSTATCSPASCGGSDMALEITYASISAAGRRTPLGGTVLPVTTSATPSGSQPTTPSPDGSTLEISLRSDAWAAVDIATSPDPTGTATSIRVVGPGQPALIRGRAGLKVSTVVTGAPGGETGADLTAIRATAVDAREIAGQASADVTTLRQIIAPDNTGWTTP